VDKAAEAGAQTPAKTRAHSKMEDMQKREEG
jgi:hypothetical protein